MSMLTHATLLASLLPQRKAEAPQALEWGEKFLDFAGRRRSRDRFEYQGSNLPVGLSDSELARHKGRNTRP
jgi:hypothetical protein